MRLPNPLRPSRRGPAGSSARKARPRVGQVEGLEGRQLLSSVSARSGIWEVVVSTKEVGSSNTDLTARLFRNGVLVRSGITVTNSSADDDDPDVSINSKGRFVVAWERAASSSNSDIKYRVFNETGQSLTGVETVAGTSRDEDDPDVHINDDGRFVVAWRKQVSSSDTDVLARGFKPTSSSGASYSTQSFTVADEDDKEYDPSVFFARNGAFAVSYTRRRAKTGPDVRLAVYKSSTPSRFVVADSTAEETSSTIASFNGTNSVTVQYKKNGSSRSRTLSV